LRLFFIAKELQDGFVSEDAMSLFDLYDGPRWRWSEMSCEFKLMLAYYGCMATLMIFGGSIPVGVELFLAGVLIALIVWRCARNRRETGWRWPGTSLGRITRALFVVGLGGLFLFLALPYLSLTDGHVVAWLLFIFGMIAFKALEELSIAYALESDMFADDYVFSGGHTNIEATYTPELLKLADEPTWMKLAKTCFHIMVVLYILNFSAFIYLFHQSYREGAPAPTVTQTEPLKYGRVVYITPSARRTLNTLELIWFGGVLVLTIFALALQYGLGVEVFRIRIFGVLLDD
jgi:hypothetical protein